MSQHDQDRGVKRPRRRKGRSLDDWEVALVKAMLLRGGEFSVDQDVLAYFSRPTRSINHRLIGQIRKGQAGRSVNPASSAELDRYLASWPELDPATGLGVRGDELLIKAREAMIAAVQNFNSAGMTFRGEMFLVTAVIAWTYLLHAWFRREGIDYQYKDRQTPQGAERYWELGKCLKHPRSPVKGGARKNLEFLIDIRHEVEHRMTDRIDDAIGAKLQACALNFNDLLKKEFGAGLGLEKRLPIALQFTTFNRDQRALLKAAAALALAGLITDRSVTGGEALFSAEEGVRVVDELADAVTQLHLPAYMNATRSQVIILVEGGFLKRMMDVGSSARASSSISKREVHAFLDSISRDVQVVDVLPAGVWPINKATQKARVTTDEVIRLLQNGALKHVYRVRGEEGYLSIHVDPEEIKSHFVPDPETTPLGVHLTAKALGMSGAAVKAFVLEGLIETATPSEGASETNLNGIMPEAVRHFKRTYVGLMQLGQELGMHHMTLKNALRDLGIKPVADPDVLTVTLFRRTDIPPEFYKNAF